MARIIIVEDDHEFNGIVREYLEAKGFSCVGCPDANSAFNAMRNSLFDLVISDIMMPGISGFKFAQKIREINPSTPILFVSARGDFSAMEQAFDLGVDDYMVKPVNLSELYLRVKALLRRAQISKSTRIEAGNLVMNTDTVTVSVDGSELSLSPREYNILYKLLSSPNRPFTRAQLMDEFWGLDCDSTLRTVDVCVSRLRTKLAKGEGFSIETVYGLGYKAVIK